MRSQSRPHSFRRAAWLVLGYALVELLFFFATLGEPPYDDSYFFKRIAQNFLDHGVLAWNLADGPVYGSTSQLFQAIVVAVTALTDGYTLLAVRFFSLLSVGVAFALLVRLTSRLDAGLAATYACCSPVVLFMLISGMETALLLALIAAFLALVDLERATEPHWLLPPLLGWLIWLARPDALLLVAPLLVAPLLVAGRPSPTRRTALRGLLLLAAAIALSLGAFKLYYGTALPLPFYAKSRLFSPYDEHFRELATTSVRLRFGAFLLVATPLFLLGLARRDRTNLVLVGSVLLFELYHLVFSIDVMGMQARFYAPSLPLLVLAAARATSALSQVERPRSWPTSELRVALIYASVAVFLFAARWLRVDDDGRIEDVPLALYVVVLLSAALLVLAPPLGRTLQWAPAFVLAGATAGITLGHAFKTPSLVSDDEYLDRHAATVSVFRGVDALLACFGDAIHVYHSEIGVPGLRFRHGTVTDLAGLMTPAWLFGRRPFDDVCVSELPAAIFLPHRNYAALNTEIAAGRCLRLYERVVERSSSPLYVRNDLVARYRDCAGAHTR